MRRVWCSLLFCYVYKGLALVDSVLCKRATVNSCNSVSNRTAKK